MWDSWKCITWHNTVREKSMVNFHFNHLSATLLWISWIITSHNYNQCKFSLICAIFCSILISQLDGSLFSYVKNTQFTNGGYTRVSIMVVWYLKYHMFAKFIHNYQDLYPLNISQALSNESKMIKVCYEAEDNMYQYLLSTEDSMLLHVKTSCQYLS